MTINHDVESVKGDTIRWNNFFYENGSTFNFMGCTLHLNIKLNPASNAVSLVSYSKYIDPTQTFYEPLGLTGGINAKNFGTAYFCLGSTYSNKLSTSYPYHYNVSVQKSNNTLTTLSQGNIKVLPNTTEYFNYSAGTGPSNFILLFDSYPGGDYWVDVQQYSAGNNFNGETYKFNSSFYEYGTAPSGYSTTGQNSGWRRKIPSSYYTYKVLPKPVTFVNLGVYGLYPYVFFSSAITENYANSVPLPTGYTQGYYYQNSWYPGFVVTKTNVYGFTASSLEAYAPQGITNYSNFDGTGRGVTSVNLSGVSALYYLGLTGPVPANGDEIAGFESTTIWPQRNAPNLVPVHDIVGIIVQIVSATRAFYKNNPEYPQPNFVYDSNIDHYVALSFGYVAVISAVIDALDLYVATAPGILDYTLGTYVGHINRYDAICAVNEINRLLKYLKTLNNGSARNTEIKNKVLDVVKTIVLPHYNQGDQYSINEYNEIEKIVNNIEKLKFSFYNTIIGGVQPGYLSTCSNGNMNFYNIYGYGATCGGSTVDAGHFNTTTYYVNNNITYPYYEYDSSAVRPLYTVQGITLGLNQNTSVVIEPYTIRSGTNNFNIYADIVNVKHNKSFKLANSTNGTLKYVDWIYLLAEDFEVNSNDEERAAWNHFYGVFIKTARNYYRDSSIPIITMQTKQTVISSGDTESLSSSGFVLLEPELNFRRTVKPTIDAGVDGIGTYATYDGYMRTTLMQLENLAYTYSNGLPPNYGSGVRFSVNMDLAQYYGRSVTVGNHIAPPSCDIKKYITGIADSPGAVASVNPTAGATYSQLLSIGDTAGNWSTNFANYRGLTFNGYIQTLIGNCYQHINTGNGRYQNWFSRKDEVQKIIDINYDWVTKYYESALMYKFGTIQ